MQQFNDWVINKQKIRLILKISDKLKNIRTNLPKVLT